MRVPPADLRIGSRDARISHVVAQAVDHVLDDGASVFRREIMLPRLIPVGPDDIADRSPAGRWRVVKRLAKALRGERARGRAGHWTYCLNRHIGLLQAFRAECGALRGLHPAAIAGRRAALDAASERAQA